MFPPPQCIGIEKLGEEGLIIDGNEMSYLLWYCIYMTMLLPVILEDHLKLLSSNRVGDAEPVSSIEV